MKERPILFSTPMVRAILEGRKTQTRRIVKPEKWMLKHGVTFDGAKVDRGLFGPNEEYLKVFRRIDETRHRITCPYGQPGDRLWVRETWKWADGGASGFRYRADGELKRIGKWKPSIHMPRIVSRITLEIVAVRVERLQSIGQDDAIAEGIIVSQRTPAEALYKELWESINGSGSWEANPWVWVVEFKRVMPGVKT